MLWKASLNSNPKKERNRRTGASESRNETVSLPRGCCSSIPPTPVTESCIYLPSPSVQPVSRPPWESSFWLLTPPFEYACYITTVCQWQQRSVKHANSIFLAAYYGFIQSTPAGSGGLAEKHREEMYSNDNALTSISPTSFWFFSFHLV